MFFEQAKNKKKNRKQKTKNVESDKTRCNCKPEMFCKKTYQTRKQKK